MAKMSVNSLVEGGKASAAPPLGPALGPLGVDIGKVIAKINEVTKSFKGMQVPIKVTVDSDTKEFEIEVGTPPASALIKKELGVEKGSGAPNKDKVGDLSIDQVKKVADMKSNNLLGANLKARVKEVAGTCVSMGVDIDGKSAKDFIAAVNKGEYNSQLQ